MDSATNSTELEEHGRMFLSVDYDCVGYICRIILCSCFESNTFISVSAYSVCFLSEVCMCGFD